MTELNWVAANPIAKAYQVNKILHKVQHDRAEEALYFADPVGYARKAALEGDALAAFVNRDVAALYSLGVNPYLLRAFCLQLRMPEADYLSALRSLKA